MSDVNGQPLQQPALAADNDNLRVMAIVIYALFLASMVSAYSTAIAGVILAYVKRPDGRGTIWESHFDNAISTFWVSLVVLIVAIPLCFVLIGFPILFVLTLWFLYRMIKGLVRAMDGKAYS